MQRLGWLSNFKELRCRTSVPFDSSVLFSRSRRYAITTERVKIQFKERRARRDGVCEPVTLTGSEMLVRIKDNAGNWHRCIASPAGKHALIHDLQFLVDHFDIPEVPDVAQLNPKQFAANKRALRALEK
jgi:hypothetical protein